MIKGIFEIVLPGIVIGAGVCVVGISNPVYSILFFIVCVCEIAVCMILLNVEFLAFSFLVVYVGAVCILFLFVVMMLNVRTIVLSDRGLNYFSLCGVTLIIFVGVVYWICFGLFYGVSGGVSWVVVINKTTNIVALGQVFFGQYPHLILMVGLLLLVAMVASIVLTLEYRTMGSSPSVAQQGVRQTKVKGVGRKGWRRRKQKIF